MDRETCVEMLKGLTEKHEGKFGDIDPKCYMAEVALDFAINALSENKISQEGFRCTQDLYDNNFNRCLAAAQECCKSACSFWEEEKEEDVKA